MKVVLELWLKNRLEGTVKLSLKEGASKSFGRMEGAFKISKSPTVSRNHGTLTLKSGQLHYKDHSTRGTYMDGKRVDELILKEGDLLQVGEYQLKFTKVETDRSSAGALPPLAPTGFTARAPTAQPPATPRPKISIPPTPVKKSDFDSEMPVFDLEENSEVEAQTAEPEAALGEQPGYPLAVRNAGFLAALKLYRKTLPFSVTRFGMESAITIVSILWFFGTLLAMAAASKLHPILGYVAFFGMLTAFGSVWKGFARYFLSMLKYAHVVVLTDLIVHGEVKNEERSMMDYGKTVLSERFGEANFLFGLGQVVKGIVGSFNRSLISLFSFVPNSRQYINALDRVLTWATTYIDESILSYGLARGEKNPWRSAREGIIYYCQNAKSLASYGIVMSVVDYFITGFATILCYFPIFAIFAIFPQESLILVKVLALVGAFLFTNSVKSCFVKPVMMILFLSKFHSEIENQAVNAEWNGRLLQLSGRFVELTDNIENWVDGVVDEDQKQSEESQAA